MLLTISVAMATDNSAVFIATSNNMLFISFLTHHLSVDFDAAYFRPLAFLFCGAFFVHEDTGSSGVHDVQSMAKGLP